jgi:hypothetical protein
VRPATPPIENDDRTSLRIAAIVSDPRLAALAKADTATLRRAPISKAVSMVDLASLLTASDWMTFREGAARHFGNAPVALVALFVMIRKRR